MPRAFSALAALLLGVLFAAVPAFAAEPAAESAETPNPLDLAIGDPARRDRSVELVLDAGVDTRSGAVLTYDELAARLDGAALVLVGEEHDSIEAHRVQRAVVDALRRRGRTVAVGLEMLPVGVQPALARWSGGELSEEELLEAVGWYEHWGMPWGYYRDVFLLAREHRLPVFALNVPREVVRAVGRGAADELAPELAAFVPPSVDLDSAEHRTLVRALFAEEMGMHGGLGDEQFEAMFAAQATWDAAMAHAAVRALAGLEGRDPVLVVLVGSGHVAYGLGIERQARRHLERPIASVIPLPVRDDDGEATGPVRASYADVVWGLPASDAPFYPSLGLATVAADAGSDDQRRRVLFVSPDSPAAAAGFAPGDLLLSFDGTPLPDRPTLNRRLAEKTWGDRATFRVERAGEPVELTVLFRRQPAP
jgi:uncharacterized iron-regulated protein